MLGAAFAAAAPAVPEWEASFDNGNNVGGLFEAVLSPAGGFGKFITVLVALFAAASSASARATGRSSVDSDAAATNGAAAVGTPTSTFRRATVSGSASEGMGG